MKPVAFAREIRSRLRAAADAADAEPMARYLLNHFPFYGVRAPAMQAIVREVAKEHRASLDESAMQAIVRELYRAPERECHQAAAHLLRRFEKLLTPVSLPVLRELIVQHSWWDTVDTIATRAVGPLVLRYPKLHAEMDAWSEDENLWLRRAAIIHQIHAKQKTDVERLFAYCTANAADRDFFIRKAIGWALRQHAYTDVHAVVEYVGAHPELSSLSQKEALKHC